MNVVPRSTGYTNIFVPIQLFLFNFKTAFRVLTGEKYVLLI